MEEKRRQDITTTKMLKEDKPNIKSQLASQPYTNNTSSHGMYHLQRQIITNSGFDLHFFIVLYFIIKILLRLHL